MKKFWKDKQVFVTGATGFIGSWLTRYLVGLGAHVTVLIYGDIPSSQLRRGGYLKKVRIVEGPLQDLQLLAKTLYEHDIDTVFHLGAQTQVTEALCDPFNTFEANIRGTYSLLEACRVQRRALKRIIVASSDKAYGVHADLPYVEETPFCPQSPYDVSKACADWIARSYYQTYHLPVVVTRCGNVYGGGDFNWDRLIPSVIKSLHQNQHPVLRSNGQSLRDYIFIADVVEAYLTLGAQLEEKTLHGEAFNFGTGKPIKTLDIVEHLIRLTNKKHFTPIIEDRATGEISEQYVSSQKAWDTLQWKPKFSFALGLSMTLEWYLQFFREEEVMATGPKQHGEHL